MWYFSEPAPPQLIPAGSNFPWTEGTKQDNETEAGEVCGGGGSWAGPELAACGSCTAPLQLPLSVGAQYWMYDGEKPVLGPAPLSELGLLESPIHAALVWGPEKNKIYFFRDGDYWRFHPSTRRVDSPVPRQATDWRGIPSEIDAAFQDTDGVLGRGWLVEVEQQLHLSPCDGWESAFHHRSFVQHPPQQVPSSCQGSATALCCRSD